MSDCGCLYIQTQISDGTIPVQSGQYNSVGSYNGFSYYQFIADGVTLFMFFNGSDEWHISKILGGTGTDIFSIYTMDLTVETCPLGLSTGVGQGLWAPQNGWKYSVLSTNCGNPFIDCCFSQTMKFNGADAEVINQTIQTSSGFFNGKPYWSWCGGFDGSTGFNLYYQEIDGECVWTLEKTVCGTYPNTAPVNVIFELLGVCECPIGSFSVVNPDVDIIGFSTEKCPPVECVPIEDRDFRVYDSIKLPIEFTEQNRGFKICCDPLMVLAGGDTESWKNDVSSAWIKISDPSDFFEFVLEKDGIPVTSYALTEEEFPNEINAFYTTIQWRDVLALEGAGCYELKISYNISGIVGSFSWAKYNLKPYSIQNALKTARIRVKFNLKQEIEGINFTGANVEDSFRFWGFIGDRQVNTEIDNLIYQDRSVKTVVRENLDTYVISTDPLQESMITALTDLYLLSENEMYISDYNAHNHSYKILDVPVVVQEAAEIDYLDRWQRRAVLTCTVGIRNKNKRTNY